jgi:hypothetical protein
MLTQDCGRRMAVLRNYTSKGGKAKGPPAPQTLPAHSTASISAARSVAAPWTGPT